VEDVAVNGDEVIVNPGDYLEGSDQLVVDADIDVHGLERQPLPRIVSTASNAVRISNLAPGSPSVSRLAIEHTGSFSAFLIQAGSAEQIVARSTRSACDMQATPAGTTLRDSVCWTSGCASANPALFVSSSVTAISNIRNVTAIAPGILCQGIFVSGDGNGATTTLDARNVIARGGHPSGDVWADTVAGATATVTLDHSNYATQNEVGTGNSSVTDPGTGTNQTSSPLFADATTGDFHQLAGSPTIDAGTSAATLLGTLDFDGEPRALDGNCDGNAMPDIGADEFSVTCPVPPVPEPEPQPEPQPAAQDTDPPETTITKAPPNKGEKNKVKYKFVADEPSTFECKADKGDFEPCDSPEKFKVDDGKHKFQVVATDLAGNKDPTPGKDKFKVAG
jgi:hypothetical protein